MTWFRDHGPQIAIGISVIAIAMAVAAIFGWQTGTIPDWIEALGTTAAFGATVTLLRLQQRDQRDRTDLLRSEQARKVAGYLSKDMQLVVGGPGSMIVTANIVNKSGLPVRAVEALVHRLGPGGMELVQTLNYGVISTEHEVASFAADLEAEYYLIVRFTDDAGLRWEKYRYGGPELVLLG